MNIGDNIRKIRERKKISRKELYLEVGISPTTLYRIENNKLLYINKEHLLKIAIFLEVSVTDLMTA